MIKLFVVGNLYQSLSIEFGWLGFSSHFNLRYNRNTYLLYAMRHNMKFPWESDST